MRRFTSLTHTSLGPMQARHSQESPSGGLVDTEETRNIFPGNCLVFATSALTRPNWCEVLQVRDQKTPQTAGGLGWFKSETHGPGEHKDF